MSGHTPGEWTGVVSLDDKERPIIKIQAPDPLNRDERLVIVCHVFLEYPEDGYATQEDADTLNQMGYADARLIMAASKLLDACKGAALMLRTALKEYAGEPWALAINEAIEKTEIKEDA